MPKFITAKQVIEGDFPSQFSVYKGFKIEKLMNAIQVGSTEQIVRSVGTKRLASRKVGVHYVIFYPDGGTKTFKTRKAAEKYIDEYVG